LVVGKRVDVATFTTMYRKKMKKPADMERDMRAAFNALDKEG
jgi:Ca2+-binding EF-hand superfamily protein